MTDSSLTAVDWTHPVFLGTFTLSRLGTQRPASATTQLGRIRARLYCGKRLILLIFFLVLLCTTQLTFTRMALHTFTRTVLLVERRCTATKSTFKVSFTAATSCNAVAACPRKGRASPMCSRAACGKHKACKQMHKAALEHARSACNPDLQQARTTGHDFLRSLPTICWHGGGHLGAHTVVFFIVVKIIIVVLVSAAGHSPRRPPPRHSRLERRIRGGLRLVIVILVIIVLLILVLVSIIVILLDTKRTCCLIHQRGKVISYLDITTVLEGTLIPRKCVHPALQA